MDFVALFAPVATAAFGARVAAALSKATVSAFIFASP